MPTMTVDELLVKIRDAQGKMSRKNGHRLLLAPCGDALIQLAVRVRDLTRYHSVTLALDDCYIPDGPSVMNTALIQPDVRVGELSAKETDGATDPLTVGRSAQ